VIVPEAGGVHSLQDRIHGIHEPLDPWGRVAGRPGVRIANRQHASVVDTRDVSMKVRGISPLGKALQQHPQELLVGKRQPHLGLVTKQLQ
jgi:hypothetical protein